MHAPPTNVLADPHAAHAAATWSPLRADRWLRKRAPLGMHFGLDRMELLMAELGDPHHRFRSVHVVGTNGKSSTVRMTAAILRRHGTRTGVYLSPHLHAFSERIEVAERQLAPRRFAAVVERVAAAADRVDAERSRADQVTQFEALTAAAFVSLAAHDVEVAVIEAGLGGRLDATSVIASEVQVLTNVGLEHTALLGTTEVEIAAEKLAVVRAGGTLVLGADLPPDVERLASDVAARHAANVVPAQLAPRFAQRDLSFRSRNLAVAEAAAAAILGALDPDVTRAAAAEVRTPGRLEVIGRAPLTVVDAAHNPHGIAALLDSLPVLLAHHGRAPHAPVVALASILTDKDAEAMIRLLTRRASKLVATGNSDPRAREPSALADIARRAGGGQVTVEPDPHHALDLARGQAGPDGVVLATGSFCLVGDLLAPPPDSG